MEGVSRGSKTDAFPPCFSLEAKIKGYLRIIKYITAEWPFELEFKSTRKIKHIEANKNVVDTDKLLLLRTYVFEYAFENKSAAVTRGRPVYYC